MLSVADAHKSIRELFKDTITDGGDGGDAVSTCWPNMAFDAPDNSIWCSVDIPGEVDNQAEIGGSTKRHRTEGSMMVTINEPKDQGSGASEAIAARVINAFSSVTYEGVTFRSSGITSQSRHERWFQTVVTCPFYFDTFR